MKMRFFLLILMFLGGGIARANLSESEAQIEARYGPSETQVPTGMPRSYAKIYAFRSMSVMVIFIDGKSESERYHIKEAESFSEADVKKLLDANAPTGSQWYRPQEDAAKLTSAPRGSILIFNRRIVASASISDYAVLIMSDKYDALYLQTHPGNRT